MMWLPVAYDVAKTVVSARRDVMASTLALLVPAPASAATISDVESYREETFTDARSLFERDGFVIVRDALRRKDVDFISNRIRQHHARYYTKSFPRMRQHPLTAPAIERLHNNTRLHSALSRVFGGPTHYRATQRADYSVNKLKGWHRDYHGNHRDDPLRRYFRTPLSPNSTFRLDQFDTGPDGERQQFVLAAAYLQDHTKDDSALTVRAGTHRTESCCDANGNCPVGPVSAGFECKTDMPSQVLRPGPADIILMDYRLLHRSSVRLHRGHRLLVALGYAAQDNLFSEAADRFFAIREAADSGGVCSSHDSFSKEWSACIESAAEHDLSVEPLRQREQRCDPTLPVGAAPSAPGQRRGCPLASKPLAACELANDVRRFQKFVQRPKTGESKLAEGLANTLTKKEQNVRGLVSKSGILVPRRAKGGQASPKGQAGRTKAEPAQKSLES